jgi:hypothetical protein
MGVVVNQVQKRVRMDIWSITKFQIAVHCHLKNIPASSLDLDCLTYLAMSGERELTEFCEAATKEKIFGSSQSVRNALTKAEKRRLIIKEGKNKKKIYINPELNIQTHGNILLDYKIVRLETEESK